SDAAWLEGGVGGILERARQILVTLLIVLGDGRFPVTARPAQRHGVVIAGNHPAGTVGNRRDAVVDVEEATIQALNLVLIEIGAAVLETEIPERTHVDTAAGTEVDAAQPGFTQVEIGLIDLRDSTRHSRLVRVRRGPRDQARELRVIEDVLRR